MIVKLYRVTLQGMTYSSTGTVYGISYAIADNMDKAYQIVRDFLDKEDLGFSHEREVAKVELMAETAQYTDTNTMLHVQQETP